MGRVRLLSATQTAGIALAVGGLLGPSASAAGAAGWSLMKVPNGGHHSVLRDVSCAVGSARWCLAVGDVTGAASLAHATLALSWSGDRWSLIRSQNGGSVINALVSVSCGTRSRCTAVGLSSSGAGDRTLVESWHGGALTVSRSPNGAAYNSELLGVSCPAAPAFCVAVGFTGSGTSSRTLVETWKGKAWSIAASPSLKRGANELTSVSCASTTSCVAVGFAGTGRTTHTLAESFDGHHWTMSTTPSTGDHGSLLQGVSCAPRAARCEAVGYEQVGHAARALAESWNGSAWALQTARDRGAASNYLTGVSCARATACKVSGYTLAGPDSYRVLLESWNGTAWSLESSPEEAGSSLLEGASCAAAASCMASGYSGTGAGQRPLVERYS
jgi:hypothetical protein